MRPIGEVEVLHGTRRAWGASFTPRPLFTPKKDPVPILREAGWAPGPVWTGAENLPSTGIRSPDRPARSHSLNRLSYPAHRGVCNGIFCEVYIWSSSLYFIRSPVLALLSNGVKRLWVALRCYCSYPVTVGTYLPPALNGVTEASPPAPRCNQKTRGSSINRALPCLLPMYSRKIFIELVIFPRCHHERHYRSRRLECNA